jgi:hypothetical protein
VRGDVTTNAVEGYFGILKRGLTGIYPACSSNHLHRYLSEFDFRQNFRQAAGYSDAEQSEMALQGIEGKRLMYRDSSGN